MSGLRKFRRMCVRTSSTRSDLGVMSSRAEGCNCPPNRQRALIHDEKSRGRFRSVGAEVVVEQCQRKVNTGRHSTEGRK